MISFKLNQISKHLPPQSFTQQFKEDEHQSFKRSFNGVSLSTPYKYAFAENDPDQPR